MGDFYHLCRLCLRDSHSYCNIFECCLMEVINQVYELDICLNDGLPEFICVQCLSKMKEFLKLKKEAHKGRSALLQLKESIDAMDRLNIKLEPEDIAEEEGTSNQAYCMAVKQEPEEDAVDECYEMRYIPIHMVRTTLGNCSQSQALEVPVLGEEDGSLKSRTTPARTRRRRRNVSREKGTDARSTRRLQHPERVEQKSDLPRHHTEHSGGEQAEFADCEKKFKGKERPFTHWNATPGADPYRCIPCNKRFLDEEGFCHHLKTHEDRPFGCQECEKRFKRRRHLVEHLRVHSGEMPFQCAVCERRFRLKSHCLRHQAIHSDRRMFVCSVCGKGLSRRDNLTAHMKLHTG